MAHANTNPLGVEVFGLAMGLGFVLSFGYWCTDFLVIQTAMAPTRRKMRAGCR
jgi:SSS family solute:Na+ symporter